MMNPFLLAVILLIWFLYLYFEKEILTFLNKEITIRLKIPNFFKMNKNEKTLNEKTDEQKVRELEEVEMFRKRLRNRNKFLGIESKEEKLETAREKFKNGLRKSIDKDEHLW